MRISDWSSDVCSSDLASIFSWVDQPILMRSGTGMPATVEYSTTGTIVSPWPPSTKAVTSSTETSNSSARKWRKRDESSKTAMPTPLSCGSPEYSRTDQPNPNGGWGVTIQAWKDHV